MTIERNERIRAISLITGPVIVLSAFLAFGLWWMGRISGIAALVLVFASPVLGILLGLVISFATTRTAQELGKVLTASHGLAPAVSFSYQESLVARGELDLARDAYESHLADHPDDVDARLALAALWRDHLGDLERAIQYFQEARRRPLTQDQEFSIGNALIDLYHSTGDSGRELVELARFAERFAGTPPGDRARASLRARKQNG